MKEDCSIEKWYIWVINFLPVYYQGKEPLSERLRAVAVSVTSLCSHFTNHL